MEVRSDFFIHDLFINSQISQDLDIFSNPSLHEQLPTINILENLGSEGLEEQNNFQSEPALHPLHSRTQSLMSRKEPDTRSEAGKQDSLNRLTKMKCMFQKSIIEFFC